MFILNVWMDGVFCENYGISCGGTGLDLGRSRGWGGGSGWGLGRGLGCLSLGL